LISLSLCNIYPKYQNILFMSTTYPSKLTSLSFELSLLNWYIIYSVLVLLNIKPFDSNIHLHNSSFWSIPILLSSINITSLVKNIHKEISHCMSFMISSITKIKIYRLNANSWCNILIEVNALMLVITIMHIFLIRVMYFVSIIFFSSVYHMRFLDILLYIFSKSINIICISFFCYRYLLINSHIKKITFMVDFSDIKSN
jgi:hypothetical protein